MEVLSEGDTKCEINVVGAGILLYMARKSTRGTGTDVQFVLAQEDFVEGWNQSGCWSAFEGGARPGESVERTAAREFVEESAGGIDINGHRSIDEIEKMLEEKRFMCKITVSQSRRKKAHVTFLVRIPWGTPVVSQFATNRDYLGRLQNLSNTTAKMTRRLQKEADDDVRESIVERLDNLRAEVVQALMSEPANFGARAAITVESSASSGPMVEVSGDFTEKRQVSVIPDYVIRETLFRAERGEMNSRSNRFRLRFCFVPVLRHVMEMFDAK